MTHGASSEEAEAEAVERMWPSNHVAGGWEARGHGGRHCPGCAMWPAHVEGCVWGRAEGWGRGLVAGQKCLEDTPKSSHTLWSMPGLAAFTSPCLLFKAYSFVQMHTTPAFPNTAPKAVYLVSASVSHF